MFAAGTTYKAHTTAVYLSEPTVRATPKCAHYCTGNTVVQKTFRDPSQMMSMYGVQLELMQHGRPLYGVVTFQHKNQVRKLNFHPYQYLLRIMSEMRGSVEFWLKQKDNIQS